MHHGLDLQKRCLGWAQAGMDFGEALHLVMAAAEDGEAVHDLDRDFAKVAPDT